MITWKNMDTLAAYAELLSAEKVCLACAMSGENGAERVKNFDTFRRVMTEEEAIAEASRCLQCGCGEGCQLCKTICTDFAPEIIDADTMHIRKEECVACGMCFNRCPNGNIEMVDLGYTV